MSEPHGHCQDTCTSARLLPGPSWQPPRCNKWSPYKGPAFPKRPVHAQGLPPLFTGYVQEITDQLISGALPVAPWLSGNRALGLKHQMRAQGVLAMNWKEHIAAIGAQVSFSAPVEEQALSAAETQLGMRLPQSLRELLAESNGLRGEYDLALIWPIERIVADNRSFRESEAFRTLYMPFEGLLFFADAGNGDQFAFAVAGGQVRRSDIFVWNHEDDSRTWLAKNLRDYLEGWISGRIAI